MWLLPTSHRLALRASTSTVVDLGADSTIEIPVREWTLITFTFENKTTADTVQSDQRTFVFSVYRNAELDISIGYSDLVLSNANDLSMFGDPSHSGEYVIW